MSDKTVQKAPKTMAEVERAAQAPKMHRIRLEESDDIPPGGQFFGLNGESWLLAAGVDTVVPQGIIDILNAARKSVPVRDADKNVIGWSERPRFAYSYLGEYKPEQEEADVTE